jgi:uncharacterized protein
LGRRRAAHVRVAWFRFVALSTCVGSFCARARRGIVARARGAQSRAVAFAGPEWTANRVAAQQDYFASAAEVFRAGGYLEVVAQNVRALRRAYFTAPGLDGTFLLGYSIFLVTMLLGLLAGRHRMVQRAADNGALVQRVQWWMLGVGVGAGLAMAIAGRFTEPFVPSGWFVVQRTAYSVSRVALMVFYVATIVRLASRPAWLSWFRPLAAAGRMPLTNYLLQSLLCTAIFYGWGLGYWGRAGHALQLVLAFGIFALQAAVSELWFRHHSYGPLEYAWRLASYGRPAAAAARRATG